MAARAYWSGHLRLSLVSLPVRLYTATNSSHKLNLHQVHKKSGERVRYQYTVPEVGPVERDEIVKGYEYEKGRFVLIEPEEIDQIKIESKKTLEIVQFVDLGDIDPMYYEKPYFLVPDGALADEAFIVIRNALRETKKVALGQIVLSGKEHITAIRPCGRGMLLETLRYADEVRKADVYFDDIKEVDVNEDQLDLAKELIRRKAGPFDPSKFQDHYQAALHELVRAKIENREPEPVEEPKRGANVINLMDALKRSLGEAKAPKPEKKPPPGKKGRAKAPEPEAEPEPERKPARKRKSA